MELSVISMENIKPCSLTTRSNVEFKPFKLSLLDQLMPSTYSPLIFFYPSNRIPNSTSDRSKLVLKLKSSLSKTLDPFYPLSGRARDNNYFVDGFESGVPFVQTRVESHRLTDLLGPTTNPKLECFNDLLPFEPYCLHNPQQNENGNSTPLPQMAIQMNTFECGGIAIGMSFNHKINDGVTVSSFLRTWTANANPHEKRVMIMPDLDRGSSVFPPSESIPTTQLLKTIERQHFKERRRIVSRRFVFEKNSIEELRRMGKSSEVENPSRIEALFAFIWKSAMSSTEGLRCLSQAVNIRPVMRPRLSKYSIGNMMIMPTVSSGKDGSMEELVRLVREGVRKAANEEYQNAISRGKGLAATIQGKKVLAETTTGGDRQQVLPCTSWVGFGGSDFDFGVGKPVWVGLYGDPSGNLPCGGSSVVLKEVGCRGTSGIEAWIKLDEDVMDAFEHNFEFLKFASPNPPIVFNN